MPDDYKTAIRAYLTRLASNDELSENDRKVKELGLATHELRTDFEYAEPTLDGGCISIHCWHINPSKNS